MGHLEAEPGMGLFFTGFIVGEEGERGQLDGKGEEAKQEYRLSLSPSPQRGRLLAQMAQELAPP